MAPTGKPQSQRKLLKQLSDQLTISDVGSLKFVCRGKIGAALLEKVDNEKPLQLFELLQQNGLISPTDLSCLQQLFMRIQRFDLAVRIGDGSGECVERRDVVDSGASGGRRSLSRSDSSISPFRSLLKELADELTSTQVEEVKFLLQVPGGHSNKIQDGQSLLVYMEEQGNLSETNLDDLKDILQDIHRIDLIWKIEKFSRTNTSQETSSSPQQVPSPGGSTYLMKPSDFLSAVGVPPSEPVPSYPIEQRVGYALIINNETFNGQTTDGKILNKRNGTQVDLTNLKDLWDKLGFQVEVHSNLKAHEILTVAQDMATKIDGPSSCFVCCLLSHGNEGAIYGSDSMLVEISSIMDFFKERNCRALAEKPKLFFVQACRGQNKLTGTSGCPIGTPERNLMPDASPPPDAANRDEPDRVFRYSADPNESHFLLGYSTPPGFVSWRSETYGSWYVHALVEIFSKYFEQEDVLSMMVRVNEQVSAAFSRQGYKQCPAPVVTLTKRIYFKNPTS